MRVLYILGTTVYFFRIKFGVRDSGTICTAYNCHMGAVLICQSFIKKIFFYLRHAHLYYAEARYKSISELLGK
jgi:hypothetical protein